MAATLVLPTRATTTSVSSQPLSASRRPSSNVTCCVGCPASLRTSVDIPCRAEQTSSNPSALRSAEAVHEHIGAHLETSAYWRKCTDGSVMVKPTPLNNPGAVSNRPPTLLVTEPIDDHGKV